MEPDAAGLTCCGSVVLLLIDVLLLDSCEVIRLRSLLFVDGVVDEADDEDDVEVFT